LEAALERYEARCRKFTLPFVGMCSYIANKFFDWNSTKSEIPELLAVIAIIIIVYIAENYFEKLPETNRPLRRYLLGNRYIEGAWIEIVRLGDKNGPAFNIGYTFIRYSKGEIELDGYSFFVENRENILWKSVACKFEENGDLNFAYKNSTSTTGTGEQYGSCQYTFSINDDGAARPREYVGFYTIDQAQFAYYGGEPNARYFVEGRLVTNQNTLSRIYANKSDFDICVRVVQECWTARQTGARKS
jgi:hypothetical protein